MPLKGLQDIVAAQTSISDIDGKLGKLWYAGYSIDDLAENSTFEEVVFLLHNLRLPTQSGARLRGGGVENLRKRLLRDALKLPLAVVVDQDLRGGNQARFGIGGQRVETSIFCTPGGTWAPDRAGARRCPYDRRIW